MRTFVAVDINEPRLVSSLQTVQQELKINAKPVDVQNLHFTLMFLGEVSDVVSLQVLEQLRTVSFSPFELNFVGLGAFPKPKFARVIWVGLDEAGQKNLKKLAEIIQAKLAPLGFMPDKPFEAHATIFRIKNHIGDLTEKLAKFSTTKFGTQLVTQFKFKQSILTPAGPVYSDIGVIKSR